MKNRPPKARGRLSIWAVVGLPALLRALLGGLVALLEVARRLSQDQDKHDREDHEHEEKSFASRSGVSAHGSCGWLVSVVGSATVISEEVLVGSLLA